MSEYQGHESWEHWNVSLWLYNDEGLYSLVQDAIRRYSDSYRAAGYLLDCLTIDFELKETPDGAVYTQDTVEAAIAEDHAEYWSTEE